MINAGSETSAFITPHPTPITVSHGAHDANRTRDLVLTKDVLCQLSYVGVAVHHLHSTSDTHLDSMERAMGFEPTTASLEGWNSTTELRPPEYRRQSCRDHNPLRPAILSAIHINPTDRRWWAGKDLNLGRHKPADLQSAPFGHLGTCPFQLACVCTLQNSNQIQRIVSPHSY